MKLSLEPWLKSLWKIVTNPAVEVVAAILLVMLAAWLVVSTEFVQRGPHVPVPFITR